VLTVVSVLVPLAERFRLPHTVLLAIAGAGHGEASNVPFTLPVPVERHFQAYAARVSVSPMPRIEALRAKGSASASPGSTVRLAIS